MSTNTTWFSLTKPDEEDFYNIDDFNTNADIIDSELKALYDEIGQAAQESTVKELSDKIGMENDIGADNTKGTVLGKLNKILADITNHFSVWNSEKAGFIENIRSNTAINNSANANGTLSQKISYLMLNQNKRNIYGIIVKQGQLYSQTQGGFSEKITYNGRCKAVFGVGTGTGGSPYLYVNVDSSGEVEVPLWRYLGSDGQALLELEAENSISFYSKNSISVNYLIIT